MINTEIQTGLETIYKQVRTATEKICEPLATEDYVVQPIVDVSPPKWHLGHTTWFFETFILKQHVKGYQEYNAEFNYVFNSYYETIGARVIRTDRGNLSRPLVKDVYNYRQYVDAAMLLVCRQQQYNDLHELIILGLNHEQQHQELLYTDIKYILGHNPLFPPYVRDHKPAFIPSKAQTTWIDIPGGTYEIGFNGRGFCWDNELNKHKVYLPDFSISPQLVSNGEFLEFMQQGGYEQFRFWHAEGWEWVKQHQVKAPLYWHLVNDQWLHYTFNGLVPVVPDEPVCHISYYEAYAYASWKKMRLPTEFEWEAASAHFQWGQRWEWTSSAYAPYPGYSQAEGALGEYNGKFMVNQQVLRGASEVTPQGHSRYTYRNFFQTNLRWQYTGIRLAR